MDNPLFLALDLLDKTFLMLQTFTKSLLTSTGRIISHRTTRWTSISSKYGAYAIKFMLNLELGHD